jgi:hypothetical protein
VGKESGKKSEAKKESIQQTKKSGKKSEAKKESIQQTKKSGKKSEAKNEEIEISTKEVEKIISREKIKSKTNIDPEEMDRVDLSFIISRRGKEWIKKEINDAH